MRLSTIILTGVLATAFTSAPFAQSAVTETAAVPVEQTQELALADIESADKEIKVSELPEAVQAALKSDAYEGWEAQRAWIVEKDEKVLYQVEVLKGEETATLLFDEKGAAIE